MGVRDLANTILFNTLFDNLPENQIMTPICKKIFSPYVTITSLDCNTKIGKPFQASYSLVGLIDLNTNLPLTQTSINGYVSEGIYSIPTRSVDTCTAKGGICVSCLKSSYPNNTQGLGESTNISTSTNLPFLNWLAKTYSGSLFGLLQEQFPYLPIREDLIRGQITEADIQRVSDSFAQAPYIPSEYLDYYGTIKDPLEQILFGIMIWSTFASVIE